MVEFVPEENQAVYAQKKDPDPSAPDNELNAPFRAEIKIGKKKTNIGETFLVAAESSEKDGAFTCPYCGVVFPKSQLSFFYLGLWITYLKRHPEGIERFKKVEPLVAEYGKDQSRIIALAKDSSWYKIMTQTLKERRAQKESL